MTQGSARVVICEVFHNDENMALVYPYLPLEEPLSGAGIHQRFFFQDVLYQHTLLDHIYMDFVDAPGGQGNWGYDALDAASEIPDPLKVTQSVERSVAMVEAKLQEAYEEGYPFHAVLAYSQGASLAALVASRVCHLESCKDLKWILMAGDASFLWELGVQSPIPVASLHIAGRNDWTVPFHEAWRQKMAMDRWEMNVHSSKSWDSVITMGLTPPQLIQRRDTLLL